MRPLVGLSLRNYRSFDDVRQHMAPMRTVHLLAGANNSGKSNVLRAAQALLPGLRNGEFPAMTQLDSHLPPPVSGGAEVEVGLGIAASREAIEAALQPVSGSHLAREVRRLLDCAAFSDDSSGLTWFRYVAGVDAFGAASGWRLAPDQILQAAAEFDGDVNEMSRVLTSSWGGERAANVSRVVGVVANQLEVRTGIPKVESVGAFRQIITSDDESVTFDGRGLIDRLAALQNPSVDRPEDRKRFDAVNEFVKSVFDDDSAAIDIPHDRSTVVVYHEGRRLPLESFGAGLHEVVILAAAATVAEDSLVCIEEPEIHLHPVLQRKFLRYLASATGNQYVVATHSAHLLDASVASISRVTMEDGATRVSSAVMPAEIAAISLELGYRASDIVQSNFIVWVEGPSDRVYVRFWLSLAAPHLIEGVDFSIMFYGGSLLSELAPSDPSVEDFIALRRLNRNLAIVIDSDRRKKGAKLNGTKQRVRNELRAAGADAWVTAGYTIENYLPPALLANAVAEVHPQARCVWQGEQYVNPLGPDVIEGRRSLVDKAAISRAAVRNWPKEAAWPLDLRIRVRELVQAIEAANT